MMIMGVPNVGKSTLMNALLNKRIAKVGDEPAITKQQQRHQINDEMILIDTPGMMWPKIENEMDGYILAANYAIGKNAYFEEEVAKKLGEILLSRYPELLKSRYALENTPIDSIDLIECIAKKKNLKLRDKSYDLLKASTILLNDYRQNKLGRITLEFPNLK